MSWRGSRIGEGQDGSDDAGEQRGFDDFDLRLGDTMRGERATLGKSLLDVQRELRIRASYIAAIENCDPTAFDTPGFIAGYVRSYARYLGMDPDQAFAQFCAESGFSVAHGMSARASSVRKPDPSVRKPDPARTEMPRDPLVEPRIPFSAGQDSLWSRIEPGAIGSLAVLLMLIGGIGYGGWSVLQEVQRVQVSPVDQTPLVFSELDPLDAALAPSADPTLEQDGVAGVFTPPSRDFYDRMQRPQALDTPVLVARDGPISTLDPDQVGAYASRATTRGLPSVDQSAPAPISTVPVTVLAVRPAFVRITGGNGQSLFAGILNGGDRYEMPASAADARIDVGESGAVYFAVRDTVYGPAGAEGVQTADISLDADGIADRFARAAIAEEPGLGPMVAALQQEAQDDPIALAVAAAAGQTPTPQVTTAMPEGVTVVATAEAWVRVRTGSGVTLFEGIMQPGDSYTVPPTEIPPTIRAGNSSAVFFAVGGETYGPYRSDGAVADGLALSAEAVAEALTPADLTANAPLASIVAALADPTR